MMNLHLPVAGCGMWAPLPRTLFTAKPPDQSQGGRALVLAVDILSTGQENWDVRPVVSIFGLDVEPVGDVVTACHGEFFQRLGDVGEQTSSEERAAIRKIFCPARQISFRRKLILHIAGYQPHFERSVCAAAGAGCHWRLP